MSLVSKHLSTQKRNKTNQERIAAMYSESLLRTRASASPISHNIQVRPRLNITYLHVS